MCLFAQNPNNKRVGSVLTDEVRTLIEDYLAQSEDTNFDFNTLFEELQLYLESPLNINEASPEILLELQLLSAVQVQDLLSYRALHGDLISLLELQSIPSFDMATIRRITPFIKVNGSTFDYNLPLKEMLLKGKNELYLRWLTVVEEAKGYSELAPGETASRYLGNNHQYYVRYKHSYGNRLSYGITAEKDRGEEFFTGSNKQGFDFYSFHFYLRNYSQRFKAIAIGDYGLSIGQGLIMFTGFASGKSIFVNNIRRGGRTVRPYTSVNEANYFRGGAITLGLSQKIETTIYASYRNRDGNVLAADTLETEELRNLEISSIGLSGFHRTAAEIEDRNAIQHLAAGATLKYKSQGNHIAANFIYNKFNGSINGNYAPYNRYYFRGDEIMNASVDYGYMLRNISLFGETAISGNGGWATINGLQIGLDKTIDMSLLYRNYRPDYQNLTADPFAESSGGRNETGVYLGMEVRPHKAWKIAAYYDLWQHPWLRFTANAPARGHEYRARITYWKKRKYETYIEVKNEVKQNNIIPENSLVKELATQRIFQTRLHLSYKFNKHLEWRSRLDFGHGNIGDQPRLRGFVIYQDILYKSLAFPLSLTARYALFDTDGYNVRYYSYENALLYTFSIPAYYDKGARYYLNLRYKGIRNLVLEFRVAQTVWRNRNTNGSGLEEIQGNTRTTLAAQIKYKF